MFQKMMLAMTAAAGVIAAAPANAASVVYTGSQQVGNVSAAYSITTDGSTGVLGATNVTSYSVTLTHNGASTTLTTQNSGILGSFTASTTMLSVVGNQDFQINTNFSPTRSNAPGVPVAVGYSDFIDFYSNNIQVQLTDGTNNTLRVNSSLGFAFAQDVVAPSVPEPTTWAMMLVGFGIVGGATRRRRTMAGVTYA